MKGYVDCQECRGSGQVWAHDPSGDGHGGLNGGAWRSFTCSHCHERRERERWPRTIEVAVCSYCGQPKPERGYVACTRCGVIGHARRVEVWHSPRGDAESMKWADENP